jgi:predicted GH43/DUF377 family glycosyl hydrolase
MSRAVSLAASTDFSRPINWPPEWSAGLRLNTNPVRLRDGSCLSTFHTWVRRHGYFNGFYLFDGDPPFRVIKVSAAPFTTPRDATGRNPRYKRNGVIFLQTLIVDEDHGIVRLAGGDNDHSVIILNLPLPKVLMGLVEAPSPS